MSKLECDKQANHSTRNAAILFALIIIGVYAPLIFLNQTYLINNPIPIENFSSESKSTIFGITIDYSMHGNYPDIKLASDMILDGKVPLWNPYVGIGYPLSADSTHHIFSPLNLGFLLPVVFWKSLIEDPPLEIENFNIFFVDVIKFFISSLLTLEHTLRGCIFVINKISFT